MTATKTFSVTPAKCPSCRECAHYRTENKFYLAEYRHRYAKCVSSEVHEYHCQKFMRGGAQPFDYHYADLARKYYCGRGAIFFDQRPASIFERLKAWLRRPSLPNGSMSAFLIQGALVGLLSLVVFAWQWVMS